MAGTIDVRIMALRGFIFDVRDSDSDAALALFRRLVDLIKGGELGQFLGCQHPRNRRRQGRFAMVDMTDGTDVEMRLGPLKFGLAHYIPPLCGSAFPIRSDAGIR
jgi:hypothetical protein